MRWKALVLFYLVVLPVRADLERAQRYLDQYRFAEARQEALSCRAEDPQRAELLELWALDNLMQGEEAVERLQRVRPQSKHARLYLIVHAMLGNEPSVRRKDLTKALELSDTAAEQVDVLLRLFRAYPFPQDQQYWRQAAEIASKNKLSDELLARLSLTHVDSLCALKRPEEAYAVLAVADRLLRKDPSRAWRIEQSRIEILNALGRRDEARTARLQLPRLAQSSLRAVSFLYQETENRSETSRASSQLVLDNLALVRRDAKDWNPRLELLAFRLRSNLAETSQVGVQEWRRQADALCRSRDSEERLIGLSERGRLLSSQGEMEQSRSDLEAAYRLARPRSRPGPLFANARPHVISLQLAQLSGQQRKFGEAQKWAESSQVEAGSDFDGLLAARLQMLTTYLGTGQIDRARQTVSLILTGAEQSETPLQRSIAYSQMLSTLILSSLESNRIFSEPEGLRIDPDSPAGWLFAEIREDPDLQARIFKALDELKVESSHPALVGVEGLFRALTLASLERPLEALDAYSQAMVKSEGYGPLLANTAMLYAFELWGAGRREEALKIMRQAHEQAQAGGSFGGAESYRLMYADFLLHSKKTSDAMALIEQGLHAREANMRSNYLVLRGRTLGSVPDMLEALSLAKQQNTREEILLELHQLQPDGAWLDQIRSRRPRRALDLMSRLPPERALQVGRESLEDFRETFEQLPTSARPAALRSPSLQALMPAILEAAIKAAKPQEGANSLAVWRALHSEPGPVSPELEQLRAELTGLRGANDPNLAQRLADTRAQFLLKTNELRQLNPGMEASLSAQVSELMLLQPQLDRSAILIQYFTAADGLYIQAITRDKQQLLKIPIEIARLRELLQCWTGALRRPRPLSAEERTASRQLYAHLIEPLKPLLAEHPDLWVLPSGELWELPFETLIDSQDHYLLESCGCAYLGPSETLQLIRAPENPTGFWLGVSNSRLPGTVREIEQLARLFPQSRTTRSWAELKGIAAEARVLHLATHSQARPDRATRSWLEMDEGPIALDQIYSLNLRAGTLVVLSSCSGAVPQQHRERDLISLSSGFRAAGASTVIAALWPIDDEATASFFPVMYESLLQGKSRLQSLRQAKLALMTKHPFYWAGFTLLGDPR